MPHLFSLVGCPGLRLGDGHDVTVVTGEAPPNNLPRPWSALVRHGMATSSGLVILSCGEVLNATDTSGRTIDLSIVLIFAARRLRFRVAVVG